MPTRPETQQTSTTAGDAVLELRDLTITFELQGGALSRLLGLRARRVHAVDGVELSLRRGEVLGLVGESGSGKTTLGRALLGLVRATSGSITYRDADGHELDVSSLRGKRLRGLRTDLQMVFQDPHAALNPSMTIEEAIGHPLTIHGVATGPELRQRVVAALERVGLAPVERFLSKYPSDLSGGQKQRAVIARAIILDPQVLVADEPVSMLDMSVRAKILQLMLDLKRELGLTYVYITHDLATAKFFCDRVAIMYLGKVVEIGPTAEIFANPRHPYTKALLAAIPEPDPEAQLPRNLPKGEIPDAADPPRGCSFHPRCPEAVASCGWEARDLRSLVEDHWTSVDPETFEGESAALGDLWELGSHDPDVARLGNGDPAHVRSVVDRVRRGTAEDPLWRGVLDVADTDRGVAVTFQPADPPTLRRAGGVEVACVLYPEGSPGEPAT
ncbi:MAG: ABC transporter ATP-binding protein [Nocardioidaceae bacterium]